MTHQHNEIFDDELYDTRRERRISREVIILNDEEDEQDEEQEEEDVEEEIEEHSSTPRREKPWMIFTTGSILTGGTLPYYRYFIAIAIMCFVSIFLTFMSLNADREYRIREKYASVLHERAVLIEDECYGLASKSAVTKRLKEHGIELIDLSKDSRLIEK